MSRMGMGIVGLVAAILVLVAPSAPVTAQESPETAGVGTVSVTPTTGLVDDQVVTITGEGFTPRHFVYVEQCRKGQGWLGCNEGADGQYARVDGNGHFSLSVRVEAVLDTLKGPFDCRSADGKCLLRTFVEARHDSQRFRTPLSFAPDAPLATPPTFDATPTTDLLDGDVLTATGSGFHADTDVYIYECPAGAVDYYICGSQEFEGHTDGAGALSVPLSVEAILTDAGLPTDCREDECELLAVEGGDSEYFETAGRVALSFVPDGALRPPPTVTVDPDTGLHGGQSVTVHGSGFRPYGSASLLQCRAEPLTPYGCRLGRRHDVSVSMDEVGDFEATFVVKARYQMINGMERNCRLRPCSVTVATGYSNHLIPTPISFAPA